MILANLCMAAYIINVVVAAQGGVTPVPSVLTSATVVKLGQDGKWPLTFDFRYIIRLNSTVSYY